MSGYILCQIKRASLPFYIENISTNIYSIEELCYYLYHNIYLLDETIINEHLCDWIKNELGLLKLYQKLYRILEEERGAGDFILAVFREINYLTHEQFKKLNEELVVLEQLPEVARKKKKGDYLVDNRMYVNAIRIYEDALRSVDTGGLGGQYEGEIFHNMGCAYLHLFQIEEAKECFEKAYEKLHTKLILKHYLCACRMLMEEAQWQGECARMGADLDTCREIQKEMEAKKPDASRENRKTWGLFWKNTQKNITEVPDFRLVF